LTANKGGYGSRDSNSLHNAGVRLTAVTPQARGLCRAIALQRGITQADVIWLALLGIASRAELVAAEVEQEEKSSN